MSDDIPVLHPKPKRRRPKRDESLVLHSVRDYSCKHPHFVLDEAKSEVECGVCKEKLNPIWVLKEMASHDSFIASRRDKLREEVKKLQDRTKYKCGSCGKMNDLTQVLRFRTK